MKASMRPRPGAPQFQLLTQPAQNALSQIELAIVFFMILIAAFSILWFVTINLLTRDFHSELIGADLRFNQRDFSELSEKSKEILNRDLQKLLTETYPKEEIKNKEKPKESNATDVLIVRKKPQRRRIITHVFGFNSIPIEEEDEEIEDANTTEVPKVKFDAEHDRRFLSTMMAEVQYADWPDTRTTAIRFIYELPFFSETVSIVWITMIILYQTTLRKGWILPKPWRIVIPSIVIFLLMSIITFTYTIMSDKCLSNLCNQLRGNLTDPTRISCGQALSVLRPEIENKYPNHDIYISLFRASYITTLVLWLMSLFLMLVRFKFDIDFQLVNVSTTAHYPEYKRERSKGSKQKDQEFTEVLLNSPQDQDMAHAQTAIAIEYPKSEDDFQSARSQLSESRTPLREGQPQYTVLPA